MASGATGSILGGFGGGVIGGAVVQLGLDDSRYKTGLAQAQATNAAVASKTAALWTAAFSVAATGAAVFAAASVKAFMESQKVQAQTAAVIESTGGAAGFTAAQIANMAASMQDLTSFSDEEVQSAENLLLTFTNIGHKAFPDATAAVLDMSTALNQDLKSSAIQLGKALNDPIAGMTALRRVGVDFNESQVKRITNLVEENKLYEAQRLILDEITKEFGGSAQAAAGTFEGKLKQLANTFNDFMEVVGGQLVPVLEDATEHLQAFAEVLPVIIPPLERITGLVREGIPAFDAYFSAMEAGSEFDAFKAGLEGIQQSLQTGGISATEAQRRIESLAEETGVGLPEGAAKMVDAMREASGATAGAGRAARQAGVQVRRFAGLGAEALAEFRTAAKESFRDVVFDLNNMERNVGATRREFLRASKAMEARAKEFSGAMKTLSREKWVPPEYVKFLSEQGPEWLIGFTDLNRNQQRTAVENWRESMSSSNDYNRSLGKITGGLDKLNRSKTNHTVLVTYVIDPKGADPAKMPGLAP